MKRNLTIAMVLVAVSALFSSCKKEYLIDVNGNLSGKVYDQYHKPLEKALIVVEGTQLKDSTDVDGSYTITGIPLGQYNVSISKQGYQTTRSMINVASAYEDGVANTTTGKKQSYDVGITLDGNLFALTGKAKGYVIYNGNPVANAKVVAYWRIYDNYNYGYTTETFETTTDADGIYNFTALPLIDYTYNNNSGLSIAAYDPQNPDHSVSTSIGSTAVLKTTSLYLDDDALQLVSYTGGNSVKLDTLKENAKITLVFNQNVSEEITKKMGGEVYLSRYGSKVAASVAYNGNKITITPSTNLAPGTSYQINVSVYATEYKYYGDIYYIGTISTPGKALTVKPVVTIASGYLKLTTVTPNATGYEIYVSRDGGKTDFLRINDSYYLTSTNGYSISGYPTGAQFYVIPYNFDALGNTVYGTKSDIVTK